jgi:uncharacterized protein (UPF0548 family)
MPDEKVPEIHTLDATLTARLAAISALDATIDVAQREQYTAANGWHVDAREVALADEAPGAPASDGAFTIASRIVHAYAFTPQRLITGRFDPNAPLLNRPMLLSARYLWVRLELAVRVSRVIDERRTRADGDEQAWGYSYHTLAGHIERGEITFEVAKHLATGRVVFRIYSFSQTGHIANPIHRWGFRLVGRRLQARFATESLQNMQRMVTEQLRRTSPRTQ